ncbi:transcriptional regulator PpsR [Aureimonas leprariae]|nr:transcriptional regulator PpsR [Aureimonas leprariae]
MASKPSPPRLQLPAADSQTLADLIAASADLTMVVDANDVIGDLSHNLQDVSAAPIAAWRGKRIDKVVNHSSHPALKAMLLSAREGRPTSGYEIGHSLGGGDALPLQYSAFHVGGDGEIVLIGRDLRPTASLQSRLLNNRQSLERNRRRQRQAETHYRILFETVSDALVVLDADTGKVRDANPRAAALLRSAPAALVGKALPALFEKGERAEMKAMLARVAATGAPATLSTDAAGSRDGLSLAAELFRADDLKLILVRLSPGRPDRGPDAALDAGLGDLVRNASEAILLIDEDGTANWGNESFLALAGIPLAAQVVGRPLDAYLQWQGMDLDSILDRVRTSGRMPMVSGVLKAVDGRSLEIETSIVARSGEPGSGYALVMRPRFEGEGDPGRGTGGGALLRDDFIEMVGRMPMKDLIRDTTDVIERMCIEAALKLSGNNRASAARMLGLSRQALYLKLNRYGIADDE